MKLGQRVWGFLGSLAVMTGGACAGELTGTGLDSVSAASRTISANQQAANDIAAAIAREVPDRGYTVKLDFKDGVARLRGTVSNPTQMHRIVEATRLRPSVRRVVNELKISDLESVQAASYQAAAPQKESAAPQEMPKADQGQALAPAVPEHTFPQGAAPQYDLPFMPPFAWPAKAPYPNYSAVQYPRHYSGSAWPYIGPFYPYPEPPLDWRSVKAVSLAGLKPIRMSQDPPPEWQVVKLRWEDGHWYLSFKNAWWARRGLLDRLHQQEPVQPVGCGECLGGGYHVFFKKAVCTHYYVD